MRKNRFSLSSFLGGIGCTVLALGMCGVAYAASVNANPVSTKLVVDGVPATLGVDEGYNIGDRNFFQLRAIAKIFDVSVEWEAATDTAVIDTTKPYTEEVPATPEPTPAPTQPVAGAATTLANGKLISEEAIWEILSEYQKLYPDGTTWGQERYHFSPTFGGGSACNAWACMISDALWGEARYTTHHDLEQTKIGDIVYLYDAVTRSGHWTVVTGRGSTFAGIGLEYDYFESCDGNANGKVSWGGKNYFDSILGFYPNSTVYSFYV